MTVHELLKRAFNNWINHPHRWTQGTGARNHDGLAISWRSERVASACSLGAIAIEARSSDSSLFEAAREVLMVQIQKAEKGRNIGVFNDNHSHEEVCEVWTEAIAATAPEKTREEQKATEPQLA